ncbi:class I SAM-dependent methyltransferase [Sulfitobacter geojensis]|jgi:SAM-dependent methyltransferase|uniref:class I SAM-dependent methyltransferase n=1 Tax=Sulfitobacter geojensis TaxID=1342299 RepID=UPI0036DF5EF0
MEKRDHWNSVYASKSEDAVSWFQKDAQPNLDLILTYQDAAARGVVDIGAGASRLVDRLLDNGVGDVTLLDLSDKSFDVVRDRLIGRNVQPTFVVQDVTDWRPARTFGVWNDRAAFHFLTDRASQDAYVSALKLATTPSSIVIMATFAEDGPERCSGLPVERYSSEALSARVGPSFRPLETRKIGHRTPGGVTQSFQYSVFEAV